MAVADVPERLLAVGRLPRQAHPEHVDGHAEVVACQAGEGSNDRTASIGADDEISTDVERTVGSLRAHADNVAIGMPPGAADGYYGAAFAALPNKTLRRIDNSLHFIMFDQPAAFAAAVDDFLKP